MKSLNPSPENCRRSGVMGTGLIPGHGPGIISIKVSHGQNQYEVSVPYNSTFGYLKSVISQSLGFNPETCKLLVGDTEKQDNESLQVAGLQNHSEVSLVEASECGQQVPGEVPETHAASKGEDAVAQVREEVDKLEQQVSALQGVIESGKKVDNKEIVYLTEMLMRQLLKLDGIEAEGEGKVHRKTEVRRVQIIVERLDTLKSRNSNPSSNTQRNVCGATEWGTFDNSPSLALPVGTSSPPHSQSTSSAPPVLPSSSLSPTPTPTFAPPVMPSSSPYPVPYPMPSDMAMQHYLPYVHPSSNYPGMPYQYPYPYPIGTPMPYHDPSTTHHPYPYQYYDPSQNAYYAPYSVPSPAPLPASNNPFSMPSTKVTENWEEFS